MKIIYVIREVQKDLRMKKIRMNIISIKIKMIMRIMTKSIFKKNNLKEMMKYLNFKERTDSYKKINKMKENLMKQKIFKGLIKKINKPQM